MVTNPMQRKARNSFLLGMTITLLITGCIIALLFMQINKMKKAQEEIVKVNVLTLNQDVKSGQTLTPEMFQTVNIDQRLVPENAKAAYSSLSGYFLQDKAGNKIKTDIEGNLYIAGTDNIQEIFTDEAGENKYMILEGKKKAVQSNNILKDDYGEYIRIDTANADMDDHINIFMEEETGAYFKFQLTENNGQYVRAKEYIEIGEGAFVARVDMKKNTVITEKYVRAADDQTTNDLRSVEVNTVLLPANLADSEYIDVRLRLPTGEDYIVISKKEVALLPLADSFSENTMYLKLNEIEIATLSNAVVEAAMIEGAYLYADKYIEAGMQEKANITYYPSWDVIQAINSNDNITNESKSELIKRYNTYAALVRGRVDGSKTEDALENAYVGIEEEVATKQEQRKQYLDSLAY